MTPVRRHAAAALVAALGAIAAPAPAATLRVPSEYLTIQAGVDAASPGDTVLVAPGTYADHEVRPVVGGMARACVFLKGGVVLRSEGGSVATTVHLPDATVQPRIMSGQGLLTGDTVVEGFTLTAVPTGYSGVRIIQSGKVTFRDCVFRDLEGFVTNAGLNVNEGDVDVLACRFIRCRTQAGGAGIYHELGRIEIRDSHFEECDTRAVLIAWDTTNSEAFIENSVFVNCQGDDGGAVFVSVRPSGTTIRGCTFLGNTDTYTGGGAIYLSGFGPRLVEGCEFLLNQTIGPNGLGGAVKANGCVATIRNNTFFGNHQQVVSNGGSAVSFGSGSSGSVLENNVIAGCTGAAAVYRNSSVSSLVSGCNVFWDNAAGNAGSGYTLGPTDREADPLFCDEVGGDYTLRQGSPCLPENSLGCGQIGAFGEGCGVVSVESTSWGQVKAAYRDPGATGE